MAAGGRTLGGAIRLFSHCRNWCKNKGVFLPDRPKNTLKMGFFWL
jgi:hypothetical protein